MSRVIDYAWGRPSITSLSAAGAVAVCRYLSYDTTGKNLSLTEAAVLRTAGIDIVSNWEYAGNWAEYSGGSVTGINHATTAKAQHLACGGPPARPIYFSTDFNPTDAQLPIIANYYRGVASVIGLARTGAYGGYRTIKYLFDAGVITWGWQTYAWSAGAWDPRVHLRQIRNGVPVGGVDCDLNDSQTADYGQWGGASVSAFDATDPIWGNGQENLYSIYHMLLDLFGLKVRPGSIYWAGQQEPTNSALIDTLTRIDTNLAALTLGGVDVNALASVVVSGVVAAHDALTDADKPLIQAAVLDALRAGTTPR